MRITYTLYVHHVSQGARFEPFLGRSAFDALQRAQDLLAGDAQVHKVDVHVGDALLFSVDRPKP